MIARKTVTRCRESLSAMYRTIMTEHDEEAHARHVDVNRARLERTQRESLSSYFQSIPWANS
jgi:hypothetical protein